MIIPNNVHHCRVCACDWSHDGCIGASDRLDSDDHICPLCGGITTPYKTRDWWYINGFAAWVKRTRGETNEDV